MRLISIISATVLLHGGAVSAAAIQNLRRDADRTEQASQDANKQYRLYIKTAFKELDTRYISTRSDVVGVYNGTTVQDALQITLTVPADRNSSDEAVSLTPYPAGEDQKHVLGLVGFNKYFSFRDLTLPLVKAVNTSNEDVTYSYDEFRVEKNEEDQLNGLGPKLLYKSADPGWIAIPVGNGDWNIKNYEIFNSVFIQNFISVNIHLEEVYQESRDTTEDEKDQASR
ncbi:hypothetical protein BGZ63DRAFT_455373 [Mariannaea sp. PMI_226]|nr:hypothetical protein BGZ63DRAFT_455373 [Mariannaea sp. PMI_226]